MGKIYIKNKHIDGFIGAWKESPEVMLLGGMPASLWLAMMCLLNNIHPVSSGICLVILSIFTIGLGMLTVEKTRGFRGSEYCDY